jgi:dynein heavy chain
MSSDEPHNIPLPPVFEDRLTSFQRLILLKVLRFGKMIFAIKQFVKQELGAVYIESPPFDLEGCLNDSSNVTPIIFVLSPGADPIAYLNGLAVKKGMKERLQSISLGQGQGVKAEKLIKEAQGTGGWVCLQNCHLSASWMPELEKIQELQDPNQINPEYRLWLTSMPSKAFPVPVLQGGLKLTNEPPKGLKANMTRSLTDIGDRYEQCTKPREYKKLIFALAYFHAAILERRKYGAIGWNIPYEWMNSDFNTSDMNLMLYLDSQSEVPYVALNYMIAQVNYGGRVTDDKDIRCIRAMLKNLFRSEIMQDGYKLSKLDIYYAPPEGTLQEALAYVSSLPLDEDPEVFGLHTNANIAFELKTVNYFIDTLLLMQPRTGGGKAVRTPEELCTDIANDLASQLPKNMDLEKAHDLTFAVTAAGAMNSLGVFVK